MTRYAHYSTDKLRSLLSRKQKQIRVIEGNPYRPYMRRQLNEAVEAIGLIEAELRAREGEYPLWLPSE